MSTLRTPLPPRAFPQSLMMDFVFYQAVLTRLEICVINAIGVDEILVLGALFFRLSHVTVWWRIL